MLLGRQTGIVRDIRLDLLERFVTNNLGGYGNSGQGVEIAVEIGSNVKVGSCLAVVHHSRETVCAFLCFEFVRSFFLQFCTILGFHMFVAGIFLATEIDRWEIFHS